MVYFCTIFEQDNERDIKIQFSGTTLNLAAVFFFGHYSEIYSLNANTVLDFFFFFLMARY